jgi:hypothetical protein
MNRIIDIKKQELNAVEPLSLDEVKKHLIITFNDDDDYLTSLITQCRRAVEEYCAISIVQKTITLIADLYKEWELPYGPVTGILSVSTRTGTEGSGPGTYETQTSGWATDGSEFISFTPAVGGFNPGSPFTGFFQWGTYASERSMVNRYKIIYTTGYSTFPEALKLAIMNEIAFRYELKGNNVDLKDFGICFPSRTIADPYKRQLWF